MIASIIHGNLGGGEATAPWKIHPTEDKTYRRLSTAKNNEYEKLHNFFHGNITKIFIEINERNELTTQKEYFCIVLSLLVFRNNLF